MQSLHFGQYIRGFRTQVRNPQHQNNPSSIETTVGFSFPENSRESNMVYLLLPNLQKFYGYDDDTVEVYARGAYDANNEKETTKGNQSRLMPTPGNAAEIASPEDFEQLPKTPEDLQRQWNLPSEDELDLIPSVGKLLIHHIPTGNATVLNSRHTFFLAPTWNANNKAHGINPADLDRVKKDAEEALLQNKHDASH